MRVEVPLRMGISIKRMLMKPHRIGKRHIEDAVVGGCKLLQQFAQLGNFAVLKLGEAGEMATARHQYFKRPNRPKGNKSNKSRVRTNDTPVLFLFELHVLAK